MATHQQPPSASVIYGFVERAQTLAFVDRKTAEDWRRAIEIGAACSTVRQLREALTGLDLGVAWLPIDLDELEELGLEDGDPIDLWQSNAAQDGDWPPMPHALTLGCLSDDLLAQFADVSTTVFNGDMAEISPSHEADLVAELRRRGVSCHRDDAFVALFGN